MDKEALTPMAAYSYIISWVQSSVLCSNICGVRPQNKEPEKYRKEERQRATQTPVKGLALPAEREEVDPEAQPLFTLAGSSENLSVLEIVGKMTKWSFSKVGRRSVYAFVVGHCVEQSD